MYVASPSGNLPSLFKLWFCGQKWPRPRDPILYIDIYNENISKSICLIPFDLEPFNAVTGPELYSKTCLKQSKIDKTKVFKTAGSLMQVESIAECSPWSILQYFRPNTFNLH